MKAKKTTKTAGPVAQKLSKKAPKKPSTTPKVAKSQLKPKMGWNPARNVSRQDGR